MSSDVYNATTTTAPDHKSKWFTVPNAFLDKPRCIVKIAEVLLSFVAFVLEEVVTSCVSCGSLYFFEFVSCTAFLFTLLLLILLSTKLNGKVGIDCWSILDFCYSAAILVLFLVASIVFSADNGGTGLEKTAVAFGFLATLAFMVDVILFLKTKGLPCSKRDTPVTKDGNGAIAENEKLNMENAEG